MSLRVDHTIVVQGIPEYPEWIIQAIGIPFVQQTIITCLRNQGGLRHIKKDICYARNYSVNVCNFS